MQRHFFPPSIIFPLVIFATAVMVAFVLLSNTRLNFRCYTIHSVNQHLLRNRPGSDSCDLSRLLARKITKGIHSCKPASLNRPIHNTLVRTHTHTRTHARTHARTHTHTHTRFITLLSAFELFSCEHCPYLQQQMTIPSGHWSE